MVGFGEVDELEVEAEGASELVGGFGVEGVDEEERLLELAVGGCAVVLEVGVAAFDGKAAEIFDGLATACRDRPRILRTA